METLLKLAIQRKLKDEKCEGVKLLLSTDKNSLSLEVPQVQERGLQLCQK